MSLEIINRTIIINAKPQTVWNTMLNGVTYQQWTSAFIEGSMVETDWKEGSEAIFGDGSGWGLVAKITENNPYSSLTIEYTGVLENGVAVYDSEQALIYAGAIEKYTFVDKDGSTELTIEAPTENKYLEDMSNAWDKALQILKELCEKTVS